MAVFLTQSDGSDRITKQPISFAAPLDHRIKKLIGHGSTHVDPSSALLGRTAGAKQAACGALFLPA
jgi:hypothetical protein